MVQRKQQVFITVGTGTADNLVGLLATYYHPANGWSVDVEVWDVNAGATYTVSAPPRGRKSGR